LWAGVFARLVMVREARCAMRAAMGAVVPAAARVAAAIVIVAGMSAVAAVTKVATGVTAAMMTTRMVTAMASVVATLSEAILAALLVGQVHLAATRCGSQQHRGTRKQQHPHGESLPSALGLACRGDSKASHAAAWATAATLRKLGKL
jgi:hypothetical protein